MTLDRETVQWVAHGVEHDIVASGPTIPEAQLAFLGVLLAQLVADGRAGRLPLSACPPSPREIVDRFESARFAAEGLEVPSSPYLPPDYVDAKLGEMRVSA